MCLMNNTVPAHLGSQDLDLQLCIPLCVEQLRVLNVAIVAALQNCTHLVK